MTSYEAVTELWNLSVSEGMMGIRFIMSPRCWQRFCAEQGTIIFLSVRLENNMLDNVIYTASDDPSLWHWQYYAGMFIRKQPRQVVENMMPKLKVGWD